MRKQNWLACAVLIAAANSSFGQPALFHPLVQENIDFRTPAREYETQTVGDLTVSIEKSLWTNSRGVAEKALARLKQKREEALAALPAAQQSAFRQIPFFMMQGSGAAGRGRDRGLVYIPQKGPDFHPQLDLRWRHCIVIYSAQNYQRITDFWALKALVHEFAHAMHLTHRKPDAPEIHNPWAAAMKSKLYRNVIDARGLLHESAYAATNQLEYFAELSCMYFIGCNYFPHNRSELESYDPAGVKMLKDVWELK